MALDFEKEVTMDPSGFVLLADYVPAVIQEIRYYSTYNFIGDRIDGYEEPCALLTVEAMRRMCRDTVSKYLMPIVRSEQSGILSFGESKIRIFA